MAKDDYYTLVAQVLVFLYKKLKGKTDEQTADFIAPMTKAFPISEDYLLYVLDEMHKHGYIQGITIAHAWGGVPINASGYDSLRITPEGIDYLRENSTIRKVAESIPGAAAIAQLFM